MAHFDGRNIAEARQWYQELFILCGAAINKSISVCCKTEKRRVRMQTTSRTRGQAAPGLDLLDRLELPLVEFLPAKKRDSLSFLQQKARQRLDKVLTKADALAVGLVNAFTMY